MHKLRLQRTYLPLYRSKRLYISLLCIFPYPTNSSNSLGCCCRSFNRALIWKKGAVCTSTSHYASVRTWVVGFLANNRGMTLLVCFPLDVKCTEAGGKWVAGGGGVKMRVKEQAEHGRTQCSKPPGTDLCDWQPAVDGNPPSHTLLSHWNCLSDTETVCSLILLCHIHSSSYIVPPVLSLFQLSYSN